MPTRSVVLSLEVNEPGIIPRGEFVFLGGTVGNTTWREKFIDKMMFPIDPKLPMMIFDPVVKDWTIEAKEHEDKAKRFATVRLYFITDPLSESSSSSTYSVAEALADLERYPNNTCVVFDHELPTQSHNSKQLRASEALMRERFPQGVILENLQEAAIWIANRLLGAKRENVELPNNSASRELIQRACKIAEYIGNCMDKTIERVFRLHLDKHKILQDIADNGILIVLINKELSSKGLRARYNSHTSTQDDGSRFNPHIQINRI